MAPTNATKSCRPHHPISPICRMDPTSLMHGFPSEEQTRYVPTNKQATSQCRLVLTDGSWADRARKMHLLGEIIFFEMSLQMARSSVLHIYTSQITASQEHRRPSTVPMNHPGDILQTHGLDHPEACCGHWQPEQYKAILSLAMTCTSGDDAWQTVPRWLCHIPAANGGSVYGM